MKKVVLKTNKFGSRPWLFKKMVSRPDGVENGEIVEIYDPEQRFVGYGFYNSRSQIALRVLHRAAKREIDADFFREKIKEAIYLRRKVLRLDEHADVYRLINSEGDGLPGLIVDRYGKTLVLSIFALGFYKIAPQLRQILSEEFDGAETIVQVDERVQEAEGINFRPDSSPNVTKQTIVNEDGLKFHVDFQTGHKTGFFCDQRENRSYIAQYCESKNVLDGCCYTGGFSIATKLKGKAGKVVGVDLDEDAIAVAKKNAELNQAKIDFVHQNVFDYLREQIVAKAHWDVVILDPPKLATGRISLEKAEKTYKDLNELGMTVVKNNGLLFTCSCSGVVSLEMFLAILRKAALRAGKQIQFLKVAGAPPDHPVMPNFPESEYLKAVLCSVRKV